MGEVHGATHVVIPDTQVKPGVPIDHLSWIGRYIVDQFGGKPNVKVIHLGDHWDMPSLSSYDKGKKAMEGRRYMADIAAGNRGMALLTEPLARNRRWKPELHLLRGNHEDRIQRAIDNDPQLDGLLSFDQLLSPGWKVYEYLKPVIVDGVAYCHVFVNPMSGRPMGGLAATRLKTVGCSFTMGHQQVLDQAIRYVLGRQQRALVAGACLTEDHRILTADLRYIPLGELEVGQEIVSFDENVGDSPCRSRRFKTGTVLAVKTELAPVYRVVLDNGDEFRATEDHLWLSRVAGPAAVVAKGAYMWRETSRLRPGTRLTKPLATWDADESYEAGWLAGMYDGEGCYYTRQTAPGYVGQLTLSQKLGPVMDRFTAGIRDRFGYASLGHTRPVNDVESVRVKGGMTSVAHVLGALRPTRLLPKFSPEHLGSLNTVHKDQPRVVAVEPAGTAPIVRVAVDAKTMIVDGYAHHNCYLHDEEYRGFQGNNSHWRGIVVCHEVKNGEYNLMEVSLDYLARKYEGKPLAKFKPRVFA